MKLNKYILEITVFICGAVVMVFELVGSRVLGPYLGASTFVWTSLIGVILGSLSLGYYIGGKMADKKANLTTLSLIILLAALGIFLTIISKNILLGFLQIYISNIKTSSVLASIILFFPTSFLMGIVSPYTVKLKIASLNTSGSTVGNLYALSTIGSITGTFLAGFYLIPTFGTNKLLIILSVILIANSILLSLKHLTKIKLSILLVFIISWIIIGGLQTAFAKNGFTDTDTEYNRVWIFPYLDHATNKPTRIMRINDESSSAMFLDDDNLVFEYTKYYRLASHFNPNFKSTLMIGGGAYSYPKYYIKNFPSSTIDVVEIDPKLTDLAKSYFRLTDNPNLKIYNEDGRTYLNKNTKKYDVIFCDAFKSKYPPYQLSTKEAMQKEFDALNDNGIVILNIISAVEGNKGKLLRAIYTTYKSIFPQVYILPVTTPENGNEVQNIIIIALKSKDVPKFNSSDSELNQYLQHIWKKEIDTDMPIITDDYAPVDYYASEAI